MCVYKTWQMSPETIVIFSFFHHILYFADFSENCILLEKKTNKRSFNEKTFNLV